MENEQKDNHKKEQANKQEQKEENTIIKKNQKINEENNKGKEDEIEKNKKEDKKVNNNEEKEIKKEKDKREEKKEELKEVEEEKEGDKGKKDEHKTINEEIKEEKIKELKEKAEENAKKEIKEEVKEEGKEKGKEEEHKENESKKEEKGNNEEIKQNKNDDNNKMEIEEEVKDSKSKEKKKIDNKDIIIINQEIKPKGLNNIGATCYMNSVLQCFYHIFDLSNELLKIKKIDESKMPMTSAYLDVIKNLTFNKKQSYSPYKFKEIISHNETFEGIAANDSKTLALYLLDTINEEFNDNNIKIENQKILNRIRTLSEKGTENTVKFFNMQCNSIIGDLFNGLKITKYKCLKCKDINSNYQIINIINLPIEQTYNQLNSNKRKKNMERKLDILDCFNNEEIPKQFMGGNQIFCTKCNKSRDGESVSKIYMSPKIMIIFLDRGMYNRFSCEVSFPEKLDMSKFVEKKDLKEEYDLIGVIEHLGPSSMGGHFIANCRHFDGKFYIFSDSDISKPSNKYQQYGVPYLIFYRKKD